MSKPTEPQVPKFNKVDAEIRAEILKMSWNISKFGSIYQETIYHEEVATFYKITLPIELQAIYAHIKQYKQYYQHKPLNKKQGQRLSIETYKQALNEMSEMDRALAKTVIEPSTNTIDFDSFSSIYQEAEFWVKNSKAYKNKNLYITAYIDHIIKHKDLYIKIDQKIYDIIIEENEN